MTPATNLTHWARLGFTAFPADINAIPKKPKEILPATVLSPGGTFHINTGINKPLNAATIRAIGERTYALFVVGEIRYDDAFGRHRETDFLLFCNGEFANDGSCASYDIGNRVT